jgi:hypothetical protein
LVCSPVAAALHRRRQHFAEAMLDASFDLNGGVKISACGRLACLVRGGSERRDPHRLFFPA